MLSWRRARARVGIAILNLSRALSRRQRHMMEHEMADGRYKRLRTIWALRLTAKAFDRLAQRIDGR